MSLGATTSAPAFTCDTAVLTKKLDRLIVQHVEMISIHSRDAAMTVTHVFAQAHASVMTTSSGHRSLITRGPLSERFLHRRRLSSLAHLLRRDPERRTACKPAGFTSTVRFLRDVRRGSCSTPGMVLIGRRCSIFRSRRAAGQNRAPSIFVSRTRLRSPSERRETSRTVQQFPHNARLRARLSCRKA